MEGIAFRFILYIVEKSKEDFIMTTSNNRIFFLVKVFSEEKYADNFIKGSIFFNTLGYFKKIEINDGRGDPNEGISHWIQPSDIKSFNIEIPNKGKISLGKEDFSGPIVIGYDWVNKVNIFCMYAVGFFNLASDNEDFLLSEDDIKSLQKKLYIDPRCRDFGDWAVVVPAKKFIGRMNKVLSENELSWHSGLVDYYDEKTFSGNLSMNDILFKKHKLYEYQKEFRYCIIPKDIENHQEKPILLEIGDISSFAMKTPIDNIMNSFQLNTIKI